MALKLADLPDEILSSICLFCPLSTLKSLSSTDKKFYAAVKDRMLWKAFLQRDFGVPVSDSEDPLEVYKSCMLYMNTGEPGYVCDSSGTRTDSNPAKYRFLFSGWGHSLCLDADGTLQHLRLREMVPPPVPSSKPPFTSTSVTSARGTAKLLVSRSLDLCRYQTARYRQKRRVHIQYGAGAR